MSPNATARANNYLINDQPVLFCDKPSRTCWQGAFQYYAPGGILPTLLDGKRSDFIKNEPGNSNLIPYPADGKNSSQILRKFAMPNDIGDWTEISFPMKRYGYAWALISALVDVAVAVLVLHAAIVAVHCVVVLARSGYHKSEASEVRNLGQLLMMALESKPLREGDQHWRMEVPERKERVVMEGEGWRRRWMWMRGADEGEGRSAWRRNVVMER